MHQSDQPVVLDVRVVRGSGGGPDKTILSSPRYLGDLGYRMLCAYMHPQGDPGFEHLRTKARAWGAPLLAIPDRGPLDFSVVARLLQICRQQRVSIWHGHDYKSNALGLLVSRFWPMRLVTTVHGWTVINCRPLYYALDRLCLRHYERVICVSEDLQSQCLEHGVPSERCLLIENAIDTQQFSRRVSTQERKNRLGIPPHRLVVGAVGRLGVEKRFDLLIRAVDQLLRLGHDLELLIVGEGDQEASLRSLIAELGQSGRMRLLGYRPDPTEFYEAMDVYALSSAREGLPNVVLEAMAMGVPVVATRVAGVPRLICDGENGLLVETGSDAELAQALGLLLGDPELRARLGWQGRRTIEERYSFDMRMRKIGDLYDEVLGKVPATAGVAVE